MSDRAANVLRVEARFYDEIADALAEGATKVLDKAGVSYERIAVPGVFEIPAAIMMARLYAGAKSGMVRGHHPRNNSHPSAAVGFTPAPSAQTGPQGAGVQAPTIVFCHRHQENDSQPLAAARNMSAPSASTAPSYAGVIEAGVS